MKNRRVVLKNRPAGLPTIDDFDFDEVDLPAPGEQEFVVAHTHIGLQPAARLRMSELPSYAAPSRLGGVPFAETVGKVIVSRHPRFPVGAWVTSDGGWQTHSLSRGRGAYLLDSRFDPPRLALGCMGTSGMTAYVGMLDLARLRPGETVVVSAASGAVGAVAGQIGKILDCRVVGVAGGPEKCAYVVDRLGFDACVDHRAKDFESKLHAACPNGIDVDFENVGGTVRDAVWRRLNNFSRIVLCGLIAEYNEVEPVPGPPWRDALVRRISLSGFLLADHLHRREAFLSDMARWIDAGRIHYREHITKGLRNAPEAFRELLTGGNFGKALVALE